MKLTIKIYGFIIIASSIMTHCAQRDTLTELQEISVDSTRGFNPCVDGISSRVCAISSKVDSILSKDSDIESKLDRCSGIPITTVTTITAPGYYCVSNPILGDASSSSVITISSNDVTLDLNGNKVDASTSSTVGSPINGITFASTPLSNIVIKNGFIIGDGTGKTSGNGINSDLNNIMTNIVISDLIITGFTKSTAPGQAGIFFPFAQNLSLINVACEGNYYGFWDGGNTQVFTMHVENCSFNTNNFQGFSFNGQSAYLVNSSFNDNSGSGFVLATGSNGEIKLFNCQANGNNGGALGHGGFDINASMYELSSCIATHNTGAGFIFGANSPADHASLTNCVSLGNTNFGFNISSSVFITFQSCSAIGNGTYGFWLFESTNNILKNCIAAYNGNTGFYAQGGGSPSINNNFQQCIAHDNTSFGFQDTAGSNTYYSNTACNNGAGPSTNYSPTTLTALVTSPANAVGADNVDCSNSTSDQLATMFSLVSCIALKESCISQLG